MREASQTLFIFSPHESSEDSDALESMSKKRSHCSFPSDGCPLEM